MLEIVRVKLAVGKRLVRQNVVVVNRNLKVIAFLGKVLPSAVMGLLVVYCLKDTSLFGPTHGLPEIIAVAFTIILQLVLKNLLLTIAGGTIAYMLLVQFIFI